MIIIIVIFWVCLGIVFYSYIGYAILLKILLICKQLFSSEKAASSVEDPEVTLFISAFNEKDFIDEKVKNGFALNYPKEKIQHLWVTDGSDDGSEEYLKKYPEITVLHEPERRGKISAMNRGMQYVKTPIVIFCDANTTLASESIRQIVNAFQDKRVGCVAGEKRIFQKESDSAAGSGEGIYWKYESLLKKWDSDLYTTVGAAGELFAVRKELFREVEPDTLLDDFMMSMRIAIQGYKIKYVPEAYAMESSSANVKEELKRKVRIAAGAIQSTLRLSKAMNPFHDVTLAFQFISHKILRWIFVPIALPVIYLLNIVLVLKAGFAIVNIYSVLFFLQSLFYVLVFIGWLVQERNIRIKILFVPYYIYMMNYAMWLGFFRFLKGKQSVNWERAKRAS